MNGQNVGQATIPAGASVTASIDLTNGALLGLIMPPAFTGTQLTFLASNDGLDFRDFEIHGNAYTETAGVNEWIVFTDNPFYGVPYLKIRSGTLNSPSVQQFDATFQLIGTVQTVEPNARRTLIADAPGYIGAWPSMQATKEGDTITADLTDCLDVGETISSIAYFVLSVVGPYGVTDPSPDIRALGTASISGGLVSQRFGNWQAIPKILYRVDIQVATSTGNSPEFFGYLPVVMQPS